MMKVLFISRKWPPAVGGMEVYSRELVNELKGRVNLDVSVLPGRTDGRPPSALAVIRFGISTAFRLLTKGTQCDIIHGGDLAIWPLVWMATLRQRGIKPILSAHGTDISLAYRRGANASLYSIYLKLGRVLVSSVRILANSNATANLCRKMGWSSVQVIPLGARVSDRVQQKPKPFVLFFGRLMPQKGCAWFIRNVLPQLSPELTLVVAGTIWNLDEKKALNNPRVDFRGSVNREKLIELCQSATAIVIPNVNMGINSFEGFGLSATEGAAAGGVVIASRLYGICEAVTDGVTGFLLPPGDNTAWAKKVEEIYLWTPNRRATFIEHARSTIQSSYSWSRVAEETIDAYHF